MIYPAAIASAAFLKITKPCMAIRASYSEDDLPEAKDTDSKRREAADVRAEHHQDCSTQAAAGPWNQKLFYRYAEDVSEYHHASLSGASPAASTTSIQR
jgi:hypothetical protein